MSERETGDREELIRERAYRLWVEEGRPEGQEQRHWDAAKEMIAIEESAGTATTPVAETIETPAEPVLAAESLGDLPALDDQGEKPAAPKRRAAPRKKAKV